jgi:hypothetical protein
MTGNPTYDILLDAFNQARNRAAFLDRMIGKLLVLNGNEELLKDFRKARREAENVAQALYDLGSMIDADAASHASPQHGGE